jgi:hypothetical protein
VTSDVRCCQKGLSDREESPKGPHPDVASHRERMRLSCGELRCKPRPPLDGGVGPLATVRKLLLLHLQGYPPQTPSVEEKVTMALSLGQNLHTSKDEPRLQSLADM